MVTRALPRRRVRPEDDAPSPHAPILQSPWFAGASEGTTLHQYQDDAFVPRFLQEAQAGRLVGTRAQAWFAKDRYGAHRDLPSLRLPLHKVFHLVCIEVACHRPGLPAFDPAKILGGGVVVRRGRPGQTSQRWLLNDGRVLGWQAGAAPDGEPDLHRRLVAQGLVPPHVPDPPPTGEASSPLHPLLVRSGDRNRTLLWGYLPLGGSFTGSRGPEPDAATRNLLAEELDWPFGTPTRRAWADFDSRPIREGLATRAFVELVDHLLNRYRVQDATHEENALLRQVLKSITLHVPVERHAFLPYRPFGPPPSGSRLGSLLEWLESLEGSLPAWITPILEREPLALKTHAPSFAGRTLYDVYLTRAQAEALRSALLARSVATLRIADEGLPFPRFSQGPAEVFHAVPFLRWRDTCGCERVTWGPASLPFRVTAPLDPEAQSPSLVVLPELSELKRGTAKGLTFLTPKSLADKLLTLKKDMKVGTGGPGNPLGLCWNFSFSLPAITICALVALMILISLLNLVFFWVPWVFLAVPRLCKKPTAL